MKKILLFYIMMSAFLYGEYLSTNGEVSFFMTQKCKDSTA